MPFQKYCRHFRKKQAQRFKLRLIWNPRVSPLVALADEILQSFPEESPEYHHAEWALDALAGKQVAVADVEAILLPYQAKWETWLTVAEAAEKYVGDDGGITNGFHPESKDPLRSAQTRICQACDNGRLRFIGHDRARRIDPGSLIFLIIRSRDRANNGDYAI